MTAPDARTAQRLLVLTLSAVLTAATTTAAPASAAEDAVRATASLDPRVDLLRVFAERSRGRPVAPSPRSAHPGPRAAPTTKHPVSGDAEHPARTPREESGLATADGCPVLHTRVVQTLDQGHVAWEAVPGAVAYRVARQRFAGSEQVLAPSLPPGTLTFEDTGHNPFGLAAYTVQVDVGGGWGAACRSPEDGYWSMSTDDGEGYPDVFFAGDTSVWEQDTFDAAFEAFPAQVSRPTFSPNGQLLATVEPEGRSTRIVVRRPSTGEVLWSVGSPAGVSLDEPAFSPDGQRIVVEGLDPSTASRGLYTIGVPGHHALAPVPGTEGLATPDWLDTPGASRSTTIVAADLSVDGGLVLVDLSTGARTPLAGTERALDPSGLPDGSVLFATYDGESGTVARRSPGGTVTVLPGASFPDSLVRWPVRGPSGEVFAYVEGPWADATAGAFAIVDVVGTGDVWTTRLGTRNDGLSGGFHGFDLRTKVSPGTSDLGGSPNPDILARSSGGVLYAYPLSTTRDFFDPRRRIGTGWNVMRQFVAAGDLNGDRRGDILAVDTSGVLWFYPGKGGFGVSPRTRVGTGWASYAIVSAGDWDGDTRADLLARDSSGRLWLYPGDGSGGVTARRQIGAGWQIFSAILGVGDWDYDGIPDILAKNRSSGVMYLYPGNGSGGFTARRVLGGGWNARTAFATPETWRGLTALFARTTEGLLLDYDSVGDGVTSNSAVHVAGTGWNPYAITG